MEISLRCGQPNLCSSMFSLVTLCQTNGDQNYELGHPGKRTGEEEEALTQPDLLQLLQWWFHLHLSRPLCR